MSIIQGMLSIVGRGRPKREKIRTPYVCRRKRTEYRTQVRTSSFHLGSLDRPIPELFWCRRLTLHTRSSPYLLSIGQLYNFRSLSWSVFAYNGSICSSTRVNPSEVSGSKRKVPDDIWLEQHELIGNNSNNWFFIVNELCVFRGASCLDPYDSSDTDWSL